MRPILLTFAILVCLLTPLPAEPIDGQGVQNQATGAGDGDSASGAEQNGEAANVVAEGNADKGSDSPGSAAKAGSNSQQVEGNVADNQDAQGADAAVADNEPLDDDADNDLASGGSVGLSDDDFEEFESVLGDLGEGFDPSHILTFAVDPGEVVCYYEEISAYDIADDIEVRPGEKETMLVGAVFVSGGSSRDISLQVIGPGGDDLLLKRAKGEDSFQLPIVESGTYEVCFGNQMSTISTKVVTTALHFQIADKEPEHLKTEDLLPVSLASDEIARRLHALERELRFLSLRYKNQLKMQNTLSLSSNIMSFTKAILVIIVIVGQVCYFTHLPFKKLMQSVLPQ